MDYEIRLFSGKTHPSVVIPATCGTDTAAFSQIIRMGIVDYRNIDIWRGLECIYVGRSIPHRGTGGARS